MLEVLNKIIKAGGEPRLLKFLKQTFPHVLAPAVIQAAPHIAVFSYYNPALLTIPRRQIIFGSGGQDLELAVKQFIQDKPIADSLILGNTAYIEYLPAELVHLASQIKSENWEIKKYRQAHS